MRPRSIRQVSRIAVTDAILESISFDALVSVNVSCTCASFVAGAMFVSRP